MMKQMKLFTVALMCMMMQTMVCNANHDVMISVSQLPSAAKTFVQKQFPGKKILYAQQDGNFKAKFETRLDDGTEIEFDRIGNWEKIECKPSAVLAALVPAPILNQVNANFPGAAILIIDKESYGFKVELANDIELKFSKNGLLMGFDD